MIDSLAGFTPKSFNTPSLVPDLNSTFQGIQDSLSTLGQKLDLFRAKNRLLGLGSFASLASTEIAPITLINDSFFNWQSLSDRSFTDVYPYEFVISAGGEPQVSIRLELPPSGISVSMPAAVTSTVTLKGYTENHNGSPLRPIEISGTSGVLNTQTPQGASGQTSGVLDYMFRNTIQAVGRVADQANRVVAAVQGNPPGLTNPKLNLGQSDARTLNTGSGWYFFNNLARFFDYYLAVKKLKEGRSIRLHFNMHKDKMYYDVTFNNFSWQKVAGTLEYQYRISLTAWKRRALPVGTEPAPTVSRSTSSDEKLNALSRIVNAVRQTRILISSASNVLAGIRNDADDAFFTPMREFILLGKDTVGLATSLADMPSSIQSGFKSSVETAVRDFNGSLSDAASKINKLVKDLGLQGDPGIPGSSAMEVQIERQSATNLSDLADKPETANPVEKLFQQPNQYVEFFDSFSPDNLLTSSELQNAMDSELNRVRDMTAEDFKIKRDKMAGFIRSVGEANGGGDATYNRVYGLAAPTATPKKMSVEDVVLISQLNDILMGIDNMIVYLQEQTANTSNDYYRFYADYAVSNGLQFTTSQSKFFVPFPGGSMESLAVQYLGSADRWIEIAALNGLRAPYIDEDGFFVSLTGSGSQNTAIISDPSNLYVGQIVEIQSNTQQPFSVKIRSIEEISEEDTLLTFEDDVDLSDFKVADEAKIHAYLPNTVNSSRLIAIPSQTSVPDNARVKIGPDVTDLNGIAHIAKTDFLIRSDGDIVITSGGDIMLANGLTNMIQAAKMKLLTKVGSMIQHPNFGNPVQPGASAADINAAEVLSQLNRLFAQDSRFSGVLAGKVQLNGPALTVDLLLGVAGSNSNLPIKAELPL